MNIKKQFIREIQEQLKNIKQSGVNYYNFLGFIEDKNIGDLERFFSVFINGVIYYDWISGNNKLKNKMNEWIKQDKYITQKEILEFINNN